MIGTAVRHSVQRANEKTDTASRVFRDWYAQHQIVCASAERLVSLSIEVVEAWKEAIAEIKSKIAEQGDPFSDSLAILVDGVYPRIELTNWILDITGKLRDQAANFECPSAFTSNFERAILEMKTVTAFVEDLHRSKPHPCESAGADSLNRESYENQLQQARLGFWHSSQAEFTPAEMASIESLGAQQAGLKVVPRAAAQANL